MFCNEVAANALIPYDIITNLEAHIFSSAKEIFYASKHLGVSSFTFLVRALNVNLLSVNRYKKLKHEADVEFKAFLQKEEERKAKQKAMEKRSDPGPYLLQLNKNSRLFT